jgi:hypothetical protein
MNMPCYCEEFSKANLKLLWVEDNGLQRHALPFPVSTAILRVLLKLNKIEQNKPQLPHLDV